MKMKMSMGLLAQVGLSRNVKTVPQLAHSTDLRKIFLDTPPPIFRIKKF